MGLARIPSWGTQTEESTCTGSGAATVQEDLKTGIHSINADKQGWARTHRQPNPSWKGVDQNPLDVL